MDNEHSKMLRIDARKTFQKKREEPFTLGVNFDAPNGITVLSGASGSGKTTTLRLIAGILTPDKGKISLDNKIFFDSEKGLNMPIQARRTGYVFQDYALFPHLTALENIVFGVKERSRNKRRERALGLLELFHIDKLRGRLPNEMSGGEQQRVALARALASDPRIVLLDEPLSAVDIETRNLLLDEIKIAQELAGIPFIFVTHNEAEAARIATNRIALADNTKKIR